ncbi:hypothetical protein L914_05990 [Phytophthora nicotianae]|uniref:Uncharacterized protein n=1 Tax=Phytophthora nicotianae TaxID=4792 RepID=W2NPJ0_PHYNI|nr:hypothetical protein L914_05990 [Phytophthora nicotianae]
MSVANLALNVGIALVRPLEDKITVNSKTVMRRRKCIAEFLIRQAPSLPYDCATEMNIPAIPEQISTSTVDTVTPDLQQVFSKFGQIENLGINDLGNRAIIAYADAAGAAAAEQASTPALRVRRRKPRQGEKRREYSPRSLEHSRSQPNPDDQLRDVSEAAMKPTTDESASALQVSEPENKSDFQTRPKLEAKDAAQAQSTKDNTADDAIVVEDIEDDQFDDILNSQNMALQSKEDIQTNTNDQNEDNEARSTANEGVNEENVTNNQQTIPSSAPKRSSVQEAPESEHTSAVEINTEPEENEAVLSSETEYQNDINDSNQKTPPQGFHLITADESGERLATNPNDAVKTASQSPPIIFAVEDDCTDTTNQTLGARRKNESLHTEEAKLGEPSLHILAENGDPTSDCNLATIPNASIEELQSRLLDMEKILSTSTSALSSTKLANEFERAVLQLHKQILDMVAECLIFVGLKHGEVSGKSMGTTNAEFLDFLEAQSKTQVKILEVEVRAGQELLRLHKTQYEKERVEFEEEITALRVGRTEAERLCAELRTDLRKCRSELACHVANATDIQRQKSVLEEKLARSEDKMHAKEVALVKLQVEYDNMHRVAAEAQMRAEKLKQGDNEDSVDYSNQDDHDSSLPKANKKFTSIRTNESLPHTSKLFSKLSQQPIEKSVEEESVPQAEAKLETSTSSRSSNVAALEAMKQQMAREIQEQIAATRASLREMEICSSSGKTLQEEEDELRQLQQQLAARSAEMDTAMNESRTKLKELLDPVTASSFRNDEANFDEMGSDHEPTIFDSTTLVNELIARAEKTAAGTSQYVDDYSSSPTLQSPFAGIGSQHLTHYHRPAQSVLYKKWTADRSRKMAQLASYRDEHAVRRAQRSMQTFQQALAEVQGKL